MLVMDRESPHPAQSRQRRLLSGHLSEAESAVLNLVEASRGRTA